MDKDINSIISFSIEPINNIQEINQTISKARVRIFYTGLNRNLTYITEEFAEKLLKTLPYTPVGGIWEPEEEDFSDHGGKDPKNRKKFSAYGVVPENPNVTWEDHLDQDGVLRRYACCDVYLWTTRYKAAREIYKKAQSMELYIDSIDGVWKRDGAIEYFEFTDGCFFGLTALGEDIEPCFEGAAFYELNQNAKDFFTALREYTLSQKQEKELGGTEMSELEKTQKETEPSVENEKKIEDNEQDSSTAEIQENTAEKGTGEENVETLPQSEEATAQEGAETETNKEQFEKDKDKDDIDDKDDKTSDDENEDDEDFKKKQGCNSQLEIENNELKQQVAQYKAEISQLKAQNEELINYKNQNELAKKQVLIEKYSSLLDEDAVSTYKDKINDYSYNDLKNEISIKVLENNENTLFNRQEVPEVVTSVETPYTGASKIMSKYFSK